jgi:hypothetical protein
MSEIEAMLDVAHVIMRVVYLTQDTVLVIQDNEEQGKLIEARSLLRQWLSDWADREDGTKIVDDARVDASGRFIAWVRGPSDGGMGSLVARLRQLLGPSATIAGTPMAPLHQDTIREIIEKMEALQRALELFAQLELPNDPVGNAGFYSIPFDRIKRARAALSTSLAEPDGVKWHTARTLEYSEEADRLREALEEIVNPLQFMQRRAEAEGNRLSGMAYSLANDVEYLR